MNRVTIAGFCFFLLKQGFRASFHHRCGGQRFPSTDLVHRRASRSGATSPSHGHDRVRLITEPFVAFALGLSAQATDRPTTGNHGWSRTSPFSSPQSRIHWWNIDRRGRQRTSSPMKRSVNVRRGRSGVDPYSGVERPGMEDDDITRLRLEGENAATGELGFPEAHRVLDLLVAIAMGAGDELHCSGVACNRFKAEPDTGHLHAAERPVRCISVPARFPACTGFLVEEEVLVEPGRTRAHDVGRELTHW